MQYPTAMHTLGSNHPKRRRDLGISLAVAGETETVRIICIY